MSEFDQRWKSVFNRLAKEHQTPEGKAGYESKRLFEARESVISVLLNEIKIHDRCLDVGCNSGHFTGMMAKKSPHITGVDFCEVPLQQAQAQYPTLSFVQGSALDLPFQDGVFDVVGCYGVLQVLEDWTQALDEIARVLKPGGVILIETNRRQPAWLSVIRAVSAVLTRQSSFQKAWGELGVLLGIGKKKNPMVDSVYFEPDHILQVARKRGWQNARMVPVPGSRFYRPGWVVGFVLYKAKG